MKPKAIVGIARELFDAEGNLDIPEPGLGLFAEMPGVEYRIFPEQYAEIAPAQVHGCHMVISAASRWTERSLLDNDQLVAVLLFGWLASLYLCRP